MRNHKYQEPSTKTSPYTENPCPLSRVHPMTEAYKVTLCVSCISGCSGRCSAEVQLSCFRGADALSVPSRRTQKCFQIQCLSCWDHIIWPSFQDCNIFSSYTNIVKVHNSDLVRVMGTSWWVILKWKQHKDNIFNVLPHRLHWFFWG